MRFNWVDDECNHQSNWDDSYNPINGYDWSKSYDDETNKSALEKGNLHLEWFDFLLGPNIIISGILNTIIQNGRY